MAYNSVYLDANVLLEVALKRPKQAIVQEYITANKGNLSVSTLSGHLLMHFAAPMYDMAVLQAFLKDFVLLPLDSGDFEWAFANLSNRDFEDALQLAVAVRNECTAFVTFDQALYRAYRGILPMRIELLN